MELSHDTKNLLDLVKKAYEGEVALPDFQRNFVWTRQDIEELIKSLLENMFIGTFLIQEINPENPPFGTIYIRGAEELNPNITLRKPRILVLDGQQRLTSLFYAIYSPNFPLKNTTKPYAFFIDLNKLVEDDIDNSVFSLSKDCRQYKALLNEDNSFDIEKLKEKRFFPLTFLSNSNKFYKIWYKHFSEIFPEEVFNYMHNILEYKVPTLILGLSYNDKPEQVVVLFERINKTGIKLSPYDLLVARFYKFIKLREKWAEAFENNIRIKNFAGDVEDTKVPYMFIQALALSKGMSIKSRDLIKIDNSILNDESWNRVVDIAENKVFQRIFDISEYGIADIKKWNPYTPTITMMLAFFLKHDIPDMDKVNKWYWSSVFSERYSGSTESKMMKDFKEVSQWIENNNKIPEVVENLKIEIQYGAYSLKKVKSSGSSKYKGVFNLIFKNKPMDFYKPDNIAYYKLEDHHIFPKGFLRNKGISNEYIDSVLNKTPILDETNKKISKKSPSKYVKEMIEIQKNKGLSEDEAVNKVKEILKGHFINEEMFEILRNTDDSLSKDEIEENFNRFIELREKLILEKILELIS
ncbi:TPA: DUF262 domain-containing protein [Methanocaldococcus jannaschii]|uniref:Uncharacterized protein MJ0686 n=2 Tax=Methanocaldococcus jannaschii TaxID=2190 RepID=Y686_METJA|nr:DUF262 domain-containing protein [Methanocaldococcus jannaschii]Q58099.1 RecName: Full=Uncharacterized protein MJ0686 [Methanocaldococcus jannaschii DSM 2661]AAB98681.1 hypothetical protein MJ_0686 [Methanocaldococcus jannaschii DSM 2661]HII59903.1 DUF262 domain-containing protein [Methanocaldococcus jannaschii]